jgi:hypothetical protein
MSCSGAEYATVPTVMLVVVSPLMSSRLRAMPKSYDAWCSDTRRDEILRRLTPLLIGAPSAEIFESLRPAVSSNLA